MSFFTHDTVSYLKYLKSVWPVGIHSPRPRFYSGWVPSGGAGPPRHGNLESLEPNLAKSRWRLHGRSPRGSETVILHIPVPHELPPRFALFSSVSLYGGRDSFSLPPVRRPRVQSDESRSKKTSGIGAPGSVRHLTAPSGANAARLSGSGGSAALRRQRRSPLWQRRQRRP
jgi:hypothetical protein